MSDMFTTIIALQQSIQFTPNFTSKRNYNTSLKSQVSKHTGAFFAKKVILKQPPEVSYKTRRSKKFRSIHTKTTVLESLFNKVADLKGLGSLFFCFILSY